jgi:outer membrane protease
MMEQNESAMLERSYRENGTRKISKMSWNSNAAVLSWAFTAKERHESWTCTLQFKNRI